MWVVSTFADRRVSVRPPPRWVTAQSPAADDTEASKVTTASAAITD